MPSTFRTREELKRARWADKFTSVSEGKLYTVEGDANSPFPIHTYFQNKLLGDKIKMLEINAGAALIEHFVADTLTTMTITINGEETAASEKEIQEWLNSIDYDSILEETCRNLYGNGYGVQQVIRTQEDDTNGFTVVTLDPATWYPDIPTFQWQTVQSGRIISVFADYSDAKKQWYAFVEKHEAGDVSYELYKLDTQSSIEGTQVDLSTLPQFKGIEDAKTDLEFIPIFQVDRQKSSRRVCGTSLLYPIWDILQEVSEAQTQLRQERIKHLRARIAVPERTLNGVDRDRTGTPQNSKQMAAAVRTTAGLYDVNQEILPIPAGSTVLPQYIQRDLQSLTLGAELIDSLLAKAAAIVGCPKSVFNIDDNAGNLKVDTEKRKDRRYVRKILQGQGRMESLVQDVIETWWLWNNKGDLPEIRVKFQDPFNLTQAETVDLVKSMNPMATLISEEDAVNMVHADKTPQERKQLLDNINAEKQGSPLSKTPDITL